MTNSPPPPVKIPPTLIKNNEERDFFDSLLNSLYQIWYIGGGQQNGVIFKDRLGLENLTTDDVIEGIANLYYTESRFDNTLSLKTTDDLVEGVVNLYSKFLDNPNLNDETEADYFYFGWEDVNGGWLIRRQSRVDSDYEDANEDSNSSYANLTTAWPFRVSLTYV